MREPPVDLSEDTLRACLRDAYGLDIADLTFLPLGHDSSAWVYRVRTDAAPCFLKARLGAVDETGLLVPRFLQDRGIARRRSIRH